jgi:hypothetical protein
LRETKSEKKEYEKIDKDTTANTMKNMRGKEREDSSNSPIDKKKDTMEGGKYNQ